MLRIRVRQACKTVKLIDGQTTIQHMYTKYSLKLMNCLNDMYYFARRHQLYDRNCNVVLSSTSQPQAAKSLFYILV